MKAVYRARSRFVCYWFEKARAMIAEGKVKRVGLLATNSIRGGANREVLKRIKETGDIFWAQSDRDWILDGAAVNVSMVGFDSGAEQQRILDSRSCRINQLGFDWHCGSNYSGIASRKCGTCLYWPITRWFI